MNTRWLHLIDDLRNSKDVDLTFQASQSISKYAEESCVPDLYILLQDEYFKDPGVQAAAADSLGSYENNPEVVDKLIGRVYDENKQVRISAITSLGYLGDKRAILPLKEILVSCDEEDRQYVGYALKNLQGYKPGLRSRIASLFRR